MTQVENVNDLSEIVPKRPPRKIAAKLTSLDRDVIELIRSCNGVVNVGVDDRPVAEWNAGSIEYRVNRLVALGVMERQEIVHAPGLPPIVHYRIVPQPAVGQSSG